MAKMRKGLWRNVLRFLVKFSRVDLNEELLKENEYLKAEIAAHILLFLGCICQFQKPRQFSQQIKRNIQQTIIQTKILHRGTNRNLRRV